MSVATGMRLGRYRLGRRLGSGGMAEVWEAVDESLHRTVAVKVILEAVSKEPTFTERFVREARTIAGLEHPNILPIYDFGREGDAVYLVMPLVPAGSLKDKLGANVPLAVSLEWISGIASALDYAHDRGILHRDIKPANVLMGRQDRPLLADFGLAKSVGDSSAGLTATGAVIGTPTYMSPEQALGTTLDRRSDQYSLGIISFQLIAGVVPFTADSPLVVLRKHLQEPPPPPSQLNPTLSPAVDRAIERALRKDPAERYARCEDLAKALAVALGGAPDAEQPTTRWSITDPEPAVPQTSEEETALYSSAARRSEETELYKSAVTSDRQESSARPPASDTVLPSAAGRQPFPRRVGLMTSAAAVLALGTVVFLWRRGETKLSPAAALSVPPTAAAVDAKAAPELAPSAPNARPAAPAMESVIEQAPLPTSAAPSARPARNAAIAGDSHSSRSPAAVRSQPPALVSPGETSSAWATAFEAGQKAFRSGNYRKAEKNFRDAVAEAEKFGSSDPRLARSLQRLGMALGNLGHLPKAEAALRRSIAIREREPEGSSLDLADSQTWLGFVLSRAGKPSGEAEALILRALATKEKVLGADDAAIALVLQHLGYCYEMQGRHADAEPRLRRALAVLERAPGRNEAARAAVLNDLGWMYNREGEPVQAEPILREALALRQRSLAANHPLLAQTDFNLADAEIGLKKYSEAEPLLRQALAIREQSLGPEHPAVASTLRELARVLRLENRPSEADQLEDRARAIHLQRRQTE